MRTSLLVACVVGLAGPACAQSGWTPEQVDEALNRFVTIESATVDASGQVFALSEKVDYMIMPQMAIMHDRLGDLYWFLWAIAFTQLFMLGWRAYDLATSDARTSRDAGTGA